MEQSWKRRENDPDRELGTTWILVRSVTVIANSTLHLIIALLRPSWYTKNAPTTSSAARLRVSTRRNLSHLDTAVAGGARRFDNAR
ncbi:hypothetical protein V8E54_003955 [Elaphomyces granulatus]